jgi:hypothetical protein
MIFVVPPEDEAAGDGVIEIAAPIPVAQAEAAAGGDSHALVLLTAARAALAEASTLDAVAHLRDQADAIDAGLSRCGEVPDGHAAE